MRTAAEHKQKFFAAIAAHSVVCSDRIPKSYGHFLQDFVSFKMTVKIVDLLEIVNIAEQQRHSRLFSN